MLVITSENRQLTLRKEWLWKECNVAETSGKNKVAHRFGGVWTEIKLKALSEYMQFYQNALKNQKFETWYVDAFAGTGERNELTEKGGLFDDVALHTV